MKLPEKTLNRVRLHEIELTLTDISDINNVKHNIKPNSQYGNSHVYHLDINGYNTLCPDGYVTIAINTYGAMLINPTNITIGSNVVNYLSYQHYADRQRLVQTGYGTNLTDNQTEVLTFIISHVCEYLQSYHASDINHKQQLEDKARIDAYNNAKRDILTMFNTEDFTDFKDRLDTLRSTIVFYKDVTL